MNFLDKIKNVTFKDYSSSQSVNGEFCFTIESFEFGLFLQKRNEQSQFQYNIKHQESKNRCPLCEQIGNEYGGCYILEKNVKELVQLLLKNKDIRFQLVNTTFFQTWRAING